MTGSIARAKVHAPILVDLAPLRTRDLSTSHFQGCAYAVDPKTEYGYLFQLQAVPTGPADVEDLRVIRFRIYPAGHVAGVSALAVPAVEYLDHMTVTRGGHVQSCHVRISAAGNPYVWAGLEQYDSRGKQQGKAARRFRYQPGKTINASSVQHIPTGPGSVDIVGCDPWTIVLRRGGNTADRYEWHREKFLLGRSASEDSRPAPRDYVTVEHGADDLYQSSLAQGTWEHPKRVVRVNGWEFIGLRLVGTDGAVSRLSARTPILAALKTVPTAPKLVPYHSDSLGKTVTNAEPEGGVTIGGTFHLVVQFNDPKRRFLGLFPLTW